MPKNNSKSHFWKQLLKNNFYLTGATVIDIFSGFFLSILFGRFVSQTTYGQYNFVYSIISFVSFTSLLGLRSILPYALNKGNEGFFKQAIKTSFIGSLIGTVLILSLSVYLFYFSSKSLGLIFLFVALLFPCLNSLALYPGVLINKKQYLKQSLFSSLQSIVPNLLIAVMIILKKDIIYLVLVGLVSQVILNVLFTKHTLNLITDKLSSQKDLRYAIKLSVLNFFSSITQNADKLILAKFLGFDNLAIYSFALLLPQQISNLLKNIQPLFTPYINSMNEKKIKNTLPLIVYKLSFIILVIVVLYIALAPYIYHLLYPQYTKSIFLSQVFALSLIFLPSTLLNQSFHKLRHIQSNYQFVFFSTIVRIVLLLILINYFGILGAIIAQVISNLFDFLLAVLLLKRVRITS